MKSRSTFILIVLLLIGVGVIWTAARGRLTTSLPAAKAQQEPPAAGSLRWYAQQTLADGQTRIAIMLSVNPMIAADLNQAISNNSVVVGDLIAQESVWYESPDSIYTWYKFRLTETLTQKPYIPCTDCTFSPTPPAGLLPLQSGEILVPILGGSAMIDDVVVETHLEDFVGLAASQRYLLFLNFDPSNSVGGTRPQGILLVKSDNTFAPVLDLAPGETEPITNGLATQYGDSLTQLRAALNPSQPGSCNPVQQQNCLDDGGTWNASNCACTPPFDPCVKKPWLCE